MVGQPRGTYGKSLYPRGSLFVVDGTTTEPDRSSTTGGTRAAVEKVVKGALFDCQMCGQCALSSTGMSCPMNCPKHIRNGPCGGVRADGGCEVKPDMRCVWVEGWRGAARMTDGDKIFTVQFAIDHRLKGSSSWLRVVREKSPQSIADKAGPAGTQS